MTRNGVLWSCPICGAPSHRRAFRSATTVGSEGVDSEGFRPASADFGATAGEVVRCTACGHGSLLDAPDPSSVQHAYLEVADETSVREEAGQLATARRDLAVVAEIAGRAEGRLLDIGCWTGSLLVAADELGWEAEGVEPSAWAVGRARERGARVRQAALGDDDGLVAGAYDVVVCCDVIEHLLEPRAGVDRIAALLKPDGYLFATVPDAGSRLARVLGARWWSVLPMHVQYFTRGSLASLLVSSGFRIERMASHPKVFSRRYYGERIGEFIPAVGGGVTRMIGRTRGADRLTAPDFRDRIGVVARRFGPS